MQTEITDKTGLPQSSVKAIAQTSDGYIWFATQEGLARYDGLHVVVYDTQHSKGLPDLFIETLAAGNDDSLWIGPRNGNLTRLRGGIFETWLSIRSGIRVVHEDVKGRIWAGSESGLYLLDGHHVHRYTRADGLPGDRVRQIVEAAGGRIWIGTDKGVATLKSSGHKAFETEDGLGSDAVLALLASSDGSLWLATRGGIVHWDNHVLERWAARLFPRDAHVSSLWMDRGGTLWVAFDHEGIARLVNGHFEHYGAKEGLPADDVEALFEDRDGDLWIGMSEAGAMELRDGLFTSLGKAAGLSEDMVWSVLSARDGSTWVGTASTGLNHIERDGSMRVYTVKDGLHPGSIISLFEDADGSIWIGSEDGTLSRFKNGRASMVRSGSMEGRVPLMCIQRDRNGDMLLAYDEENGLFRLRGGQVVTRYRVPGILNTMAVAPDASIWLGTDHAGLLHLENAKTTEYTTKHGLLSNFVPAVYRDRDGILWVGSSLGGLNRIKDGQITSYSVKQGLFNLTVDAILEDDHRNLWITCNKGIYRVSKIELNDFADGRVAAIHSVGLWNSGWPARCRVQLCRSTDG